MAYVVHRWNAQRSKLVPIDASFDCATLSHRQGDPFCSINYRLSCRWHASDAQLSVVVVVVAGLVSFFERANERTRKRLKMLNPADGDCVFLIRWVHTPYASGLIGESPPPPPLSPPWEIKGRLLNDVNYVAFHSEWPITWRDGIWCLLIRRIMSKI